MRFAKCKTFEEGLALCRKEGASIYITIAETDGCEYQFHQDGACYRITQYCPICSKNGDCGQRIQAENHVCPKCGKDYTPRLESSASSVGAPLSEHARTDLRVA
jgi:hypothetical protein